jgi:hypothetical protein
MVKSWKILANSVLTQLMWSLTPRWLSNVAWLSIDSVGRESHSALTQCRQDEPSQMQAKIPISGAFKGIKLIKNYPWNVQLGPILTIKGFNFLPSWKQKINFALTATLLATNISNILANWILYLK